MNKLITTNNGGMPLELDDIRWFDEGYRNGFTGLLRAFGGELEADGYILTGLTATDSGSNWTIAGGYVAFNNEVWEISAQSIAYLAAGQKYVIEEDLSFDATGNETFEDGSVADTYQIRKGKFTSVAAATTGKFDYMTGSGTGGTVIAEYVKDKINGLTGFSLTDQTNNNLHRNLDEGAWYSEDRNDFVISTHSASDGTGGSFIISSSNIGADSYFKYKKIGKTLYGNFNLESMLMTDHSTGSNYTILSIRLTPNILNTFNGDQFSSCVVTASDTGSAGAAMVVSRAQVKVDDAGSALIFNMYGISNQNAAFNRRYVFAGTTDVEISANSDAITPTVTIRGSFTFELA